MDIEPGVTAPVSITWVTPPTQPTSLPSQKIGTMVAMSQGCTLPMEQSLLVEHVAGVDAGVLFPVVLDHVLDRGTHGAHVDDDAGRGQHAVAGGVVEGEAELAFLLHDRRRGDLLRGFAGVDQPAAQLREQLFVARSDRFPSSQSFSRPL